MTSVIAFITATCILIGGTVILFSSAVVALSCCVFMATVRFSDGPHVRMVERWLARAFLFGAVLSSIASVGVLLLAMAV